MKEEAWRHSEQEFKAMSFRDLGAFAAFWTDVAGEYDAARAERRGCTKGAVRVAKWKALAEHPCGETLGQCAQKPGCAHEKGAELWRGIVNRASKIIIDEADND